MKQNELKFSLKVFENESSLSNEDSVLLNKAKAALQNSYSPYSNFKVAAAVLLNNGEILTGTNQENASYPAGLCAEATVLSAVSAIYPGVAIKKMAITVKSNTHLIEHPVAPCGICRQRMLEYENRFNQPMEIILAGETGEVYVVSSIKDLLPLYFSNTDI